MHGWLVRVVPSLRASMPLNPYAAPFVKGSSSAAAASDAATSSISAAPRVFCDLDGCLVDFEKGCKSVTGKTPDKLTPKAMWSALARTKGFYENLDWMPDGRRLWEGVESLRPTILTGLPLGKWAEPQKRNWCKRELGADVPVITCMSRDKHKYCRQGNVLIDDRLSLEAAWKSAGGVFIHHTSASSSLEKLKALLPADRPTLAARPEPEAQGSAKRQRKG
ncbi:unnamed protein product [Pylaiella littoralis]